MNFLARCWLPALVSMGVLSFGAPLWLSTAQAQKKNAIHAGEGELRLNVKDWRADQDEVRMFQSMQKGELPVSPGAEAVIDHGAQWYAYRLTYQDNQEAPARNKMHQLVKEALDQVLDPHDSHKPLNSQQQTFVEEFGKRFTERLHEVVKNPKPIARVNAASILARLAATGQEDAGDVLAEVIQDPKENDGVKLWACFGLRDLFGLARGENPVKFKSQQRESQWAQALYDYVNRKIEVPSSATPAERAAIPYVRKEAILALGQTRYPAVANIVNKKIVLDRQTALALLRIMGKDGIKPTPTLSEQVAAAVGLCRLQSKLCDEYQADYAAYQLGKFLVEFGGLRNQDTNKDSKAGWKVHAFYLLQALNELRTDLEGPPKNDSYQYVSKLLPQAETLLNAVLNGGTPEPNSLEIWLERNPPKHNSVYRDVPTSIVHESTQKVESR